MSELTIEGFREILREAVGDDESVQLGDNGLDTPFEELGFDSLALLETVALIKRRCGVGVADDELTDVHTPRQLLTKVNAVLTTA